MKRENGNWVGDGSRNPAPSRKYDRGIFVDEEFLRRHKKETEDRLKCNSLSVLFPYRNETTEGPVFAAICNIAAEFSLPEEKRPHVPDPLPGEPPFSRQAAYLKGLEQQVFKLATSLEDIPPKARAYLFASSALGGQYKDDFLGQITSNLWTLRGYARRAERLIQAEESDLGGRKKKKPQRRFIRDLVSLYTDHAAEPAPNQCEDFLAAVFEGLGLDAPARLRQMIYECTET